MSSNLKHLIIVPGHGIWKRTNDGSNTEDWFLESFQVEGHDHLLFIEHIKIGIKELQKDPEALLLFSGGQTKKQAGPISEAQSYYLLAENLGLLEGLTDRISTEEFARDSFENVLYSLSRFNEIVGNYPSKITVPGFEFKRSRFLDYHFPALKFPIENVNYIGVDPKPDYEIGSLEHEKYFNDLSNAENRNALSLFAKDPFGTGEVLSTKRTKRNPFNRYHGYLHKHEILKFFFEQDPSKVNTVPW
ncbi:hypothetical protein BN7_6233 [Wickerhamomyces ciferrii]|uniref:DUF218 domain-containing protein n=1 Tax=Wickerhamomyces ciferrii (strain ATCC 14091 / BCRC 22168 / CBS 111 / JCM 3599 / NBRC 0793 / NRRL Y-1031 F-60-10) TaxID=1206466 RepID=K0KZQ3_WICCF|nr:uncharacterized protein BN7_6233 [Wickerhamomyces ciferrii]CCH46638.1 hypothetical protein BN7_6233 [Wickerhamomyces ciferrii]